MRLRMMRMIGAFGPRSGGDKTGDAGPQVS
jgi:hypothetical protein